MKMDYPLVIERIKIIQYFSFCKRYDLYELKVIDYWYFEFSIEK